MADSIDEPLDGEAIAVFAEFRMEYADYRIILIVGDKVEVVLNEEAADVLGQALLTVSDEVENLNDVPEGN